MMADPFQAVFIVGATSGIGEELARQYHAKGKQVIICGRRTERLNALKAELPGLGAFQLDIQDLDALPQNLSEILAKFPNIDSVIINVGIQQYLNFSPESFLSSIPQNKGTPSTTAITTEINTNLTGPVILARLITSHFLSTAPLKPATIAFVTSGLAYVPVPIFPLYCATKSALHYFVVALRAQFQGTPLSIVEIVPPYVATELDSGHKDVLEEFFKGNMPKGVDAKIYVEGVIRGLDASGEDGKVPKLIGDGFPRKAADAWVEAYAPMAKIFGLEL